jgi:hypothetical protein
MHEFTRHDVLQICHNKGVIAKFFQAKALAVIFLSYAETPVLAGALFDLYIHYSGLNRTNTPNGC